MAFSELVSRLALVDLVLFVFVAALFIVGFAIEYIVKIVSRPTKYALDGWLLPVSRHFTSLGNILSRLLSLATRK